MKYLITINLPTSALVILITLPKKKIKRCITVLYGPHNNIISHSSYANSRYPMEKSYKGVGFLGRSGPGIFTFLQFQRLNSFNLTTVWFVVMQSLRSVIHSEDSAKPTTLLMERPNHNTGNMPFPFQLVNGIFHVSQNLWRLKRCETRPTVYIPYQTRL